MNGINFHISHTPTLFRHTLSLTLSLPFHLPTPISLSLPLSHVPRHTLSLPLSQTYTLSPFLTLPLTHSLPPTRNVQLYIHRSGRTARANAVGTTVSLVAPEDAYHHSEICLSLTTAGVKEMVRTIKNSTVQGIEHSEIFIYLSLHVSTFTNICSLI